jgi:hypothetical protein
VRASVEDSRYRVISFLAAGVPEHQFKESFAVHVSCNRCKLCPDSNLMILREGVVSNPLNHTGFPNSGVSDENKLKRRIKTVASLLIIYF